MKVSTIKTKQLRFKYNFLLGEKVSLLDWVESREKALLFDPDNEGLLKLLQQELKRVREITAEMVSLDAEINKILMYGKRNKSGKNH